jgi:hypothetical protein
MATLAEAYIGTQQVEQLAATIGAWKEGARNRGLDPQSLGFVKEDNLSQGNGV